MGRPRKNATEGSEIQEQTSETIDASASTNVDQSAVSNGDASASTNVDQSAVSNGMADFDIFTVRPKKVVKEDRRSRSQWTEIEHFELYQFKKTVRLEPHNAEYMNAFAEGIPTYNDFGDLYLPAGKYKAGDKVDFFVVYPDKQPEENMYRVLPQTQQP